MGCEVPNWAGLRLGLGGLPPSPSLPFPPLHARAAATARRNMYRGVTGKNRPPFSPPPVPRPPPTRANILSRHTTLETRGRTQLTDRNGDRAANNNVKVQKCVSSPARPTNWEFLEFHPGPSTHQPVTTPPQQQKTSLAAHSARPGSCAAPFQHSRFVCLDGRLRSSSLSLSLTPNSRLTQSSPV